MLCRFYGCPTLSYGRVERRNGVVTDWSGCLGCLRGSGLYFVVRRRFPFFFFIFHQFQFNVFIFSPFSSQTSCICVMIITLLPYIGGMARFPCHNPTQKRIPDRLWRIRSLIVDSRSFIGGFTDLLRRANTLTASSISSRTYINHRGPTTCTLFMTPSQLANFSAWRHTCSERYCPFVDPVVRWMDLLADPPSPGDKAQRK